MGQTVDLQASDGHGLSAYMAQPAGKPRGAVVVIQEVFGVTRHIRGVTDQYAGSGFLAIAPALFDRIAPNIDVPYTDVPTGRAHMLKLKNEAVMLDLQAAIDKVSFAGKLATVGYCWGGTMSYLAAARLRLDAAIAYYGGGIHNLLEEKPRCPIMFQFGEKDSHIPSEAVDKIKAAVPNGIFYMYDAEHGFNCNDRSSFDPPSAKLAFERSSEFLHRHLG